MKTLTEKEILKEVEEEKRDGTWDKPISGIPLISKMSSTASSKHKGWWRRECSPKATEEGRKQCFKSLEQQRKLKMPDHSVRGKKVGENKDYLEYSDRGT